MTKKARIDRRLREAYLAMIKAEHGEPEDSWWDWVPGVLMAMVIVLIAVVAHCLKQAR